MQSINGLAGDAARHDWFYYVNGIEAAAGAASTAVHRGDRIWWDLHDWSATDDDPRGRRLVPRAVRARRSAASGCRPRSSARPDVRRGLRRRWRRSSRPLGVPAASAAARHRLGHRLARGAGRHLARRCTAGRRGSLIAHGPARQRRLRAVHRPGGDSLQLLDPQRPSRPHARRRRRPDRRHRDKRLRRRPGSSPAPTRPACSAAAAALTPGALAQPLRAGRAGASRTSRCRCRGRSELPAAGQPAARRPRRRRLCLLPGARVRGAAARPPGRARRGRGRDRSAPGSPPAWGASCAARRCSRCPLALRDRAGQRARHARRADRDRAPRASCPCSGTPTSRSRRPSTARARPARGRADPVRRAVHGGRRPRRGAAAVPARLVPLGADRDARHAHGAGARPRRPPAGRRAALPARPAAVARWR